MFPSTALALTRNCTQMTKWVGGWGGQLEQVKWRGRSETDVYRLRRVFHQHIWQKVAELKLARVRLNEDACSKSRMSGRTAARSHPRDCDCRNNINNYGNVMFTGSLSASSARFTCCKPSRILQGKFQTKTSWHFLGGSTRDKHARQISCCSVKLASELEKSSFPEDHWEELFFFFFFKITIKWLLSTQIADLLCFGGFFQAGFLETFFWRVYSR